MKKYYLKNAEMKGISKLIEYKSKTILMYMKNIDSEERERIERYIQKTVPEDIDDYRLIYSDEMVIGCLSVKPYDDGFIIDELYLEPLYRNRGIGRNIIKKIIEADSSKPTYLWVYKANKKAIKLYKGNFKNKSASY